MSIETPFSDQPRSKSAPPHALDDDDVFDPLQYAPPTSALDELRAIPHWVSWKYYMRPGATKPTKPPVDPNTGGAGSHSDPKTWAAHEKACWRTRFSRLAGVGFVLTDGDGLTGIDLDACRDAETGELEPWAAEIVELAETYAEVSPSGTGVRLLARGKVASATKCDPAHVEIYGSLRYLTITGNHIDETPEDIRPAPQTIERLLARVAAHAPPPAPERKPAVIRAAERPAIDGKSFFRAVNERALANLDLWVTAIFPSATKQGSGGFRVKSKDLGRPLQEDIGLDPGGIKDFGVADMGDPNHGRRTAIDMAMEWGGAEDATAAAKWLCDKLGVTPEALGWRDENAAVADLAAQLGRTLVEDEDGTLHDPETGEVFEPAAVAAEVVEAPERHDFAEAILERDGLVPAIAHWILSVSRRPQKRLAVASALTVVATAASRQLQTPTHSNLNLYVVMIAPSGAGKEAPMKAAIELLLQSGLPEMIGPDGFQSDTSIYDKLRQQPACLAAINEFGSYLAVATARQAPAHIQKVLAALRKFYDGGTLSPPHAATRPSEVLFNPCLTILGSSTPMQFYSAITGAQTEDGTLNRFVTVTARGNPSKFDTSSCPTDVPPYIRQMMQQLADRPGGVNCYMFRTPLQPESYQLKPEAVNWTVEAREHWNAYEDQNSLRMAGNPSMDGFAARCPLNALRIATVLAIGENIENPLVNTEHIDIAKSMVEASLRDMIQGYDENAMETSESRLADRIRRTLAKNGGSMGRSDLVQCLKRHIRSTKNLDEVLGVLIEAHEIAVVVPTVGDKGGRPGKRYRLLI